MKTNQILIILLIISIAIAGCAKPKYTDDTMPIPPNNCVLDNHQTRFARTTYNCTIDGNATASIIMTLPSRDSAQLEPLSKSRLVTDTDEAFKEFNNSVDGTLDKFNFQYKDCKNRKEYLYYHELLKWENGTSFLNYVTIRDDNLHIDIRVRGVPGLESVPLPANYLADQMDLLC